MPRRSYFNYTEDIFMQSRITRLLAPTSLPILFLVTPLLAGAATTPSPSVLTNMIGTNIHMHDNWADEVYGNIPKVETALTYAGIKHARDMLYWDDVTLALQQIHRDLGTMFDIFAGADVLNKLPANAYMIEAIEGSNEPEKFSPSYNGLTRIAASVALQKVMLASVKSHQATQNIPVFSMSLANLYDYAQVGDISAYTDQLAIHVYPMFLGGNGLSSYDTMKLQMGLNANMAPGKPQVITEGGWWTAPCSAGATQAAQAKLTLSYLLDAYSLGVTRVYYYELMDAHSNKTSIEDCFGMFNFDFTPKLSATSIHNLNIILADSGGTSKPGTLTYNLTGMPANGHSAIFERSDGAFVFALWRDDEIWDNNGHEVAVTPATVTLTPGVTPTSMSAYNALVGTSPISATAEASIQISLSDTPIFVIIMTSG
jgi:hypothetical protein